MANAMQELMDMRIWMLWRWGKDKNGNPTKVPFAISGGSSGTNKEWSHTWGTYKDALAAKVRFHAAGIGFKIPENYFFLDIDDRELSDPLVQTLFARFDSYTEYSVSGTGIHIYGKCDFSKLPTFYNKEKKIKLDNQFYQNNRKVGLELYVGGITTALQLSLVTLSKIIPSENVLPHFLPPLIKICERPRK